MKNNYTLEKKNQFFRPLPQKVDEHGKLFTTPCLIHVVTQEVGCTFCSWGDFKDKEVQMIKGHNFYRNYRQGLYLFTKIMVLSYSLTNWEI